MTVKPTINKNPDAVFGKDTQTPDFRSIAEQIRALDTRALTAPQTDDVLTLIDFMRDRTLELYDQLEAKEAGLTERKVSLDAREQDIVDREKALDRKIRAFRSAVTVRQTIGQRVGALLRR